MTESDTSPFWKNKIVAFLHDFPHKSGRSVGHENQRASFLDRFELDKEEIEAFERKSDWQAASADRLFFPKDSVLFVDWKESWMEFRHPLGGGILTPKKFPPTAAQSEEALTAALDVISEKGGTGDTGDTGDGDWKQKFIAGWRLWQEIAAREHSPHFAYLVADTRIPDHTLWHHSGLASAFSSCANEPAFLLFQIGPVQDFITQARSLRDLWSGSYLLSYLIAQGMLAIAEEIGPDSIVYPQLRGAPLADFHWWKKGFLKEKVRASHENELLVPNLPNRFLALVPASRAEELAHLAEAAIRKTWEKIASSVRSEIEKLAGAECPGWDANWDSQTSRFPVVDWVAHAWSDTKTALGQAATGTPPLHGGWSAHPLKQAYLWATQGIPQHERESFAPESNSAFAWSLHYALTDWKFSAKKNARPFAPWTSSGDGVPKDHLDGKNEVLGGESHEVFWETLRRKKAARFKGKQLYGALTAIKRLWDETYLKEALDISRSVIFEPVDAIAQIDSKIEDESDCETYYAVLAMDGDDMGQWVSGCKAAPLFNSLAEPAQSYFKKHWKNGGSDTFRRPLSPGYHAALSEALANFSLYCARPIVEAFGGQLIYAGGDDVLAMLPVAGALDCAQALQAAFRGIHPDFCSGGAREKLCALFDYSQHVDGFLSLKKDAGTHVGRAIHLKPNWPLMVVGPLATASVGISIGHVHSPMQDVIQLAREAEKQAKKIEGKGAFCLRVAKRSGEATGFAAKWNEKRDGSESAGALSVWAELSSGTLGQSQNFAYRFVEFAKTLLVEGGGSGGAKYAEKWTLELVEAVTLELAHTLRRQADFEKGTAKERAKSWMENLSRTLSPEAFVHFWMTWAFFNRITKK